TNSVSSDPAVDPRSLGTTSRRLMLLICTGNSSRLARLVPSMPPSLSDGSARRQRASRRGRYGYPHSARKTASGLRDHEHDGHDGEGDAADGEQPDDAERERQVSAGSQRMLQLALALCADDQQPDRKSRVAAAEQNVRPWGDVEQVRGEPAH